MWMSTRRRVMQTLSLSALAPCAIAQSASGWPSRALRIVVAYPAGGVSDVVARLLAERVSAALGVPVVVENKAGASGTIGMDAVAKAAADGYTLGFSSVSPLTLNPHLGRSPFDPVQDIAPVVGVMYSPVVLLATSACPARDWRALMELAQRQPGRVRWATSGQASLGHIVLEQVMAAGKVQISHVPYKGGGQQMNDALSGQFEVLSTNASAALLQHVAAGRLHPLAIGAPARLEAWPQVPTLAEAGMPAANLASRFGIFAPARMPQAVLERLNQEFNKALALPEIRQRLLAADNVPLGGTAEAFARRIASESQANEKIIRAAGIKPD